MKRNKLVRREHPAEFKVIQLRRREQAARFTNYALRETIEMDRGLLRDTTRKLEALRDEVARAKKIAGAMSVLWSQPCKIRHGGRPGDRVEVESEKRFDPLAPIGPNIDTMTFARMPLDIVLTRVREDVLERCVHARVEFRDGEVGYGLTNDALRALESADELERQVTRQIAPALVRELFDKAAPWRRNRGRNWR